MFSHVTVPLAALIISRDVLLVATGFVIRYVSLPPPVSIVSTFIFPSVCPPTFVLWTLYIASILISGFCSNLVADQSQVIGKLYKYCNMSYYWPNWGLIDNWRFPPKQQSTMGDKRTPCKHRSSFSFDPKLFKLGQKLHFDESLIPFHYQPFSLIN